MTIGLRSGYEVADLGSISSVGATSSQATTGLNLCFQVTASGIGTNVQFRFEGSLDDTNYFNLDANEQDTTLTANGTYGYALNGCPVKFVRLNLTGITGGSPSISAKVGCT